MFISAASTALIITLPALIATVRRLAMSVTRLPVIVVGRINDPRVANTILVSGKADLVGMARQSLADPETPNKAKEGRFLDIRRCVGCLHGCVGHIDTGRRGTCELNPMIGHEADPDYQIRKTETPKNVLIIGAGPGGLSAAITAAQCGHHAKVYDKDKWVGGSYRIASIPPGKGEIANFCAWQAHTLKKLGVPVILNTEVTKELVEQEQPDVIIAATGVTPIIPKKIPGVDKDLVVLGQDVLYFLLILGMGMGTASRSIHFGLLFFVLILSGLFQGAHYGFPTLLLSNAVDYGEWKTKRSDIGVTFGLNSLAMSLGSAIGGTLVGFLLDAIHYVPNVSQTPSVQNGMLVGAILVPVALTAVQFVLHLFFGLTDAQHARCVRELAGQDTDRS